MDVVRIDYIGPTCPIAKSGTRFICLVMDYEFLRSHVITTHAIHVSNPCTFDECSFAATGDCILKQHIRDKHSVKGQLKADYQPVRII